MEHFAAFIPLLLFIVLLTAGSGRKKRMLVNLLEKRKERRPGEMPVEFLREFIGQVCEISLFDGMGAVAMLEAVEGNWLKISENGRAKLVNGELVRTIAAMPEKYQEKYRRKQNQ